MIDLNHNGMSDIWEWTYNVYGINPDTDPDGDGFVNWQEAIAGTDPLNRNSYPHIPIFSYTPTNVVISLPCYLGKEYTLESITNLNNPVWELDTSMEATSGTNTTFYVAPGPGMELYRVMISDVDSDGTGLMNDWEKYQLGSQSHERLQQRPGGHQRQSHE